ncbi:MAG: DUF1501 domain-containing protein [Planctomycetales bacterium]|nr:DUF1501 domain-containing protein [Planctomycetales bacterium]
MLSIVGKRAHHCDGVSRREFLAAGVIAGNGFTLADLLRAEAVAGIGSSQKAIILLHLDGGPPQMDLIDPKPSAPAELRGEFRPISTAVPGLQFSEMLPQLAARADKLIAIRSLIGAAGRHDAFQCQSGHKVEELQSLGGWPAMGCVLAKLLGTPVDVSPTFVDLMLGRPLVRDSARPGFLGPSYQAFRPDISQLFARPLEEGMKKELAQRGAQHAVSMSLIDGIPAKRLEDRGRLLTHLDRVRRRVDQTGAMDAMDQFHQQAANILTSGRLASALDLQRCHPRDLQRYTAPAGGVKRFTTAEDRFSMRKLLFARRLIEAGVRCVSVSFSDFDTHQDNYPRMRQMLPILDHGLSALLDDLQERGMLDDVSIVAWGEFGRTPKINKNGGRDHWPRVGMALLAGGGMRTGQVIGATDRMAGEATSRPVRYQDVFTTLYHNLGIDAGRTTIEDPRGRPRYLAPEGRPIREVV